MRALLAAILEDVVGSIYESLPSSEREAGPFVSGMVWAFVLFWVTLIVVTWWYAGGRA